jgi:hypothetical protein
LAAISLANSVVDQYCSIDAVAVMKAWQQGSVDDGDDIEITFGANAQAQKTVQTKQTMEAIQLEDAKIEPVTQLPLYDSTPLYEELHRILEVGAPKMNDGTMHQLQQLAMIGKQVLMAQQAMAQQQGGAGGGPPQGAGPRNGSSPHEGPSPSEGSGPQEGTLTSGAHRGTVGTGSAPTRRPVMAGSPA